MNRMAYSLLIFILMLIPFEVFSSTKLTKRVGDVEGIVAAKSLSSQILRPEVYYEEASKKSKYYGFDAQKPLTIELTHKSYQFCTRFSVDKDYTVNDVKKFIVKYEQSKVILQGVEHYGGTQCTFKSIKIKTTKLELERQHELERAKEEKGNSIDIKELIVKARRLTPKMLKGPILVDSKVPLSKKELLALKVKCRSIRLSSAIDVSSFQPNVTKIKLTNIKTEKRKCYAERIELL